MKRIHAGMKRLEWKALDAFTRWFASGGGVYQTFFVTAAVVVVELADRRLDPHAFGLMAILTVYSAVTQPALAFSGTRAAQSADERAEALEERLSAIEQKLDGIAAYLGYLDERS